MKSFSAPLVSLLASLTLALPGAALLAADSVPAPEYHIYAGSTHAHTNYTWSHGSQWAKDPQPKMVVEGSVSKPSPSNVQRPESERDQGPPAEHFALAKTKHHDFYVVTDHSQEVAFQPVAADNPAWLDTKKAARDATDAHFVALAGYEHSENNGPGGQGHLNVINSATYLNALAPGVDLPHFYAWLKTAPADGEGPVVATFNHPGAKQYANWANCDPEIADIITMLEVINSNDKIHYEGWLAALDAGWKVAPVCGNDNHGLSGIGRMKSRTFLLATALTKPALLDAMKHRRTYASLDGNLQGRYTVNGAVMGSTLARPDSFKFDIAISDPDTDQPGAKITKIDIVKDHGVVVETYTPTAATSQRWTPTITDRTAKYFFVRVWSAGGGDAPDPDPTKPIAWLAPVWTGR
jgi:hypothetical protein